MSRTRAGLADQYAAAFLAVIFAFALSATAWAAQFHLPKIPKLGKSEPAQQQKKAEAGPAPEVTSIEPNSASPGAEGDVVLTGKNFTAGTSLRMNCPEEAPLIQSFKVESATRAVAHIKFPFGVKEGPCEIFIEVRPVPGNSEIAPSSVGTTEVVQVKTVSFTISMSSAMPMALPVIYIGEGNMDFMAVMMKVQQAMQGSWNDSGKPLLRVTKSELKLVEGEKTVFTEPASGVKEIGQMSMAGQSVGVFRIVCTDGKIYNFMEQTGQGLDKGQTVSILKSMLGK
jgi:hypothetical protein